MMRAKFLVLLFFTLFQWNLVLATPLDDYVQKSDPTYSWKLEKTLESADYTTFVVDLKSQTWRDATEASQPLWRHSLIIIRPKELRSDKALLYVGKGTSKDLFPTEPDPKWVRIAKETKSIVAEVRNVPNKPLTYLNDGTERYEDNSVAYSWNKVMTTHDPNWNIRFPMVKSIIRAMDTVDALLGNSQTHPIKIKGYVIAGESKRGWATWLASAVDQRIIGIIPMVIDVLNVQKFLRHHYDAYGFWSPAIKDYINHNIIQRFESDEFSELMKFEDPYFYRDRISIPKYLINASGDQFFLPDSSQLYFGQLIGPKYLRYLPNADHSMKETDAFDNLQTFYSILISSGKFPQISWQMRKDGSISVKTNRSPTKVLLWSATNPEARDFRVMTIGKSFASTPLSRLPNGTYLAKLKAPKKGFSASFIELTFANGLTFTTQVRVLPDVLPFKGKAP